ncbi:MAG: CBS domain-containing protein [Actinomycetota bacterium]
MTTVREIMSQDLVAVEPSVTMMGAVEAMSVNHAGSVLVLEDGALIGIFTERDVLRALHQPGNADAVRVSPVRSWMTSDPDTIGAEASVGEALDHMLTGGFRHLPVTERGVVVGVVSMRDLARSLAKPDQQTRNG